MALKEGEIEIAKFNDIKGSAPGLCPAVEAVHDRLRYTTHTEGADKFDTGKPDLSLIDPSLVNAAARALGFGAKKYGRNNYKKGMDINRLYASLLRHTFARISGELVDKESGLDHLDHMAANIQLLTYMVANYEQNS